MQEKYFRFKPCRCCEGICEKYAVFEYEVVDGLICKTREKISHLVDYKSGKLYGIDYSSCIAVLSLIYDVGTQNCTILELCCAPGAKMMFILDKLSNAIVVGVDIRKDRLSVTKSLLRKYNHLNRAQLILGDARNVKISVPCYFEQGGSNYESRLFHSPRHLLQSTNTLFDYVLVDAECTIDGKTHVVPKGQQLSNYGAQELFEIQSTILQNGFNHLKHKGRLVYATCSLNPHENECVVSTLLDNNTDAKLVIPSLWDTLPLDKSSKYCTICQSKHQFGMRMNYEYTQTSGMFVAVVTKD